MSGIDVFEGERKGCVVSGVDSVALARLPTRGVGEPTRALHPSRRLHGGRLVLGYASVDAHQWERGKGELQRQVETIAAACQRRGLVLLEVVREPEPQRQRPLERPGLGYLLGRIESGEVSGVVVSELSRVSRSVPQLGSVLERLANHGSRLVAVESGLDTDDEAGRLAIQAIVEVSRWERRRLSERTRKGMRAARRNGPPSVADHPGLSDRIASMRGDGMTLQAISDRLNADGIPTVRGGAQWRPSSVQAAAGYRRQSADNSAERQQGRGGGTALSRASEPLT